MTWTGAPLVEQIGIFTLLANGSVIGDAAYQGDGASGVYLWQADEQLGSFATSPITTTSAAVTRAADVPQIDGLSVLSPWTLYARGSVPATDAVNAQQLVNLAVGADTANRANLFRGITGNAVIQGVVSGSAQFNTSTSLPGARTFSTAVSQDGVTWRAAVEGTALTSAAGGGFGATPLTLLSLGCSVLGLNSENGYLSRVIIRRGAYSDAQLAQLTAA